MHILYINQTCEYLLCMECPNWIKLVWWKCLFHIRRTKHVKWQLFRPLPSAPPQPLFLVSSLGSLLNINPPISSYSCKNRLSRLSERHPTFSGTTICLDEETGFFHVFAQLLLLHLWHYQDSGAETSEAQRQHQSDTRRQNSDLSHSANIYFITNFIHM